MRIKLAFCWPVQSVAAGGRQRCWTRIAMLHPIEAGIRGQASLRQVAKQLRLRVAGPILPRVPDRSRSHCGRACYQVIIPQLDAGLPWSRRPQSAAT